MTSTHIYDSMVELYGEEWLKRFPKIVTCITDYINTHADVLQTKNFGKALIFTGANENKFFESAGVDRNDLVGFINESLKKGVMKPNSKGTTPIYQLCYILSIFYTRQHKELVKLYKLDPSEEAVSSPRHIMQIFHGIRLYSFTQKYIFKYPARDDVMDYVIANMSRKFKIVKMANLYEFISTCALTNNTARLEHLSEKYVTDDDCYEWVNNLFNRFNSVLKEVYRLMMEARENNNKIVTENIQATNDEGKTFYVVTDSVSNTIDTLSKKVTNTYIQDPVIRKKLLTVACKNAHNVSSSKVELILKSIRESADSELLLKIIRDIISYWIISLRKSADSIHSAEFASKCSKAYSISNTYDPFIIDLKENLTKIVKEYGPDFVATTGKSTLNSFKQAVYLYLVMYIMAIK